VSKPEKQMTGPHFIYLGAALWVLALILLHWPGGMPTRGKAEAIAILGIPIGIVCILIGVIMIIWKLVRRQ
jgi:membrane protein DedA with SNARE-associated domain